VQGLTASGVSVCVCIGVLAGCGADQKKSGSQELPAQASAPTEEGQRLKTYSQKLEADVAQVSLKPGGKVSIRVKVTNTSGDTWFGRAPVKWVDASYRWLDESGEMIVEGKRTLLNKTVVGPGETDALTMVIDAPGKPGRYTLLISMVQEGEAWFFSEGTQPLLIPAIVT